MCLLLLCLVECLKRILDKLGTVVVASGEVPPARRMGDRWYSVYTACGVYVFVFDIYMAFHQLRCPGLD